MISQVWLWGLEETFQSFRIGEIVFEMADQRDPDFFKAPVMHYEQSLILCPEIYI